MKTASFFKMASVVLLLAIVSIKLDAQIFTNLYSFTGGSDGSSPQASLVLAGSTLYGTTEFGGSSSDGTVFAVNTNESSDTVLTNFNGSDGYYPVAGLVLTNVTLYGITLTTLFKVNTNGSGFAVLTNFTSSDGVGSEATLILSGNTLYGTAFAGGSSNEGTVFKVNTDGSGLTVLKNFPALVSGTNSDGANPHCSLVLSGNTLYGTTESGGSSGNGVVFEVNTNGNGFGVLKNFPALVSGTNSDGANPYAGLTLSGNTLYGTTYYGGSFGDGTVFRINTNGSSFTNLHNFNFDSNDGYKPYAGLISSGNTLYGTTEYGGSGGFGFGTVFSISGNGSGFTILYTFTGGSDGGSPQADLLLSGNTLYGTTSKGGQNYGTVFKLDNLPAPPPSTVSGSRNTNGSFTINFAGGPNCTYLVQTTTNLTASSWGTISTNVAGTNGLWQFTDTNAGNYSARFYRSATP